MANPLVADLKSVLITEDTATAPSKGVPAQITASAVSGSGIVSTDLSGASNSNYAMHVFEALDGDCKGQKVIGTRFQQSTDTLNVTDFWKTSPTGTQFRHWKWNWPHAPVTTDGFINNAVSAERTEADNYWWQYQMLSFAGMNTDLKQMNDKGFVAADDAFYFSNMTSNTKIGDAMIPVQCMQPAGVEITAHPGTALEREIITDSLDPEGIVLGAQEELGLTMSPEIRGIATAAGDGVAALAPDEMHVALGAAFTEDLDTGDTDQGASSATAVNVSDGTRFSQYNLALINGDAGAISAITVNELAFPTGHLSSAPASGDVVYAGANYRPKDSGHSACSFFCWVGDSEMIALTGGMAEWSATIMPNEMAKYDLVWQFCDGLRSSHTKAHDDLYDTSTPLVGRSNYSRVVLDGTELLADVVSANINLLHAPISKQSAFGATENRGGLLYTARNPGATLVIQMEDSNYWHRYRALGTFDFLIQLGSIPTACWALWAPRAQIVEISDPPEESDGLLRQTVTIRFLRPTTQGQPAYSFAHF
jgi:hypothetical protein